MSNLLPREAKHAIVIEYRLRLLVVWCFILALSFFVSALLLLPSYVAVSSDLSYAESALMVQAADTGASYASTLKEINTANSIGQRLAQSDADISITDILREVDAEFGRGIQFVGLSIVRTSGSEPQIELQGIAATRDELARFVERLKANPYIADASVPFAQLAQAANSAFSVTIQIQKDFKKVTP